ncbi:MAG TPA: helix-turn-helix transcriptional regulator [Gemmatimonadales bacterium]|jgi:ribosome-binding protein aMBF1 (putative translation factor)
MARKAQRKRSRHIGRSLNDFIREQREKDPQFAAEFDRLEVARLVRDLRERKKVSQGELAARVGTKQPAIARLESGRVIPKLDLLDKVARALGRRLTVRFVEEKVKRAG